MQEKQIEAPWTDEQVRSLNAYQNVGTFHPFTCGNHRGYSPSLVATNRCWQCPECSYVQGWCWRFMADWSWARSSKGKVAMQQQAPVVPEKQPDAMLIDDSPNTLKIEEVFVFISKDEEGNEGVCAFATPNGMMPMVAADKSRLDSLRDIAKQIAQLTNKSVHLIKLSSRENLEEIN